MGRLRSSWSSRLYCSLSALLDPKGGVQRRNDAVLDRQTQREDALARMGRELEQANSALLAAQLAENQAVQSLAVVAHELRSPICSIRNAMTILLRASPADTSRAWSIIERQIGEMTRMVDDLMDLSRANTGKLTLVLEPVCLRSIVERASANCASALNRRRQRLLIGGAGLDEALNADPLRLLQILGNLLDNASKYSPDCNAIHLDVQALEGHVRLSVTDRGIGISADALGCIFEPFSQEARAASFDRSGLGVGLALVRDLVEAHGGTVSAHSDGVGRGASFVVTFPCCDRLLRGAPRPW